jgi:NAD-dependent dihydropyrimidine dehydrogenase PreA subunit
MRADGIFIAVEVDDTAAADAELAVKLSDACPVDIFAQDEGGGASIVEKNLDECVLCGLCLAAAPEGTVKIVKLYDDDAILTIAGASAQR